MMMSDPVEEAITELYERWERIIGDVGTGSGPYGQDCPEFLEGIRNVAKIARRVALDRVLQIRNLPSPAEGEEYPKTPEGMYCMGVNDALNEVKNILG